MGPKVLPLDLLFSVTAKSDRHAECDFVYSKEEERIEITSSSSLRGKYGRGNVLQDLHESLARGGRYVEERSNISPNRKTMRLTL